jgi:acyl carrier protein
MHTAGIFRDAALLQLDRDNLRDVLRAKVSGAWSLHRATRGLDLDFFILFSSFSAITPPHGQASYAAASAFLDAVAHARRAEGKAALSINWGAWSDIGFAATDVGREAHARLESMGMRRMTPGEGLAALARLMGRGIPAQMAVFPMDVRTIGALDPALEHAPLLRELVVPESTQVHGQSAGVLLHAMRQMDAEAQRELLREEVARMVSAVMEIPRVRLDVTVPLTQLGLDSLIAVQLKNLLEKETGLSVPLVNTLRGASVASMVDDLLVDLRLGALRAEVQAVEAGAQQELEL